MSKIKYFSIAYKLSCCLMILSTLAFAQPQCSDGIDNDGDGKIDFLNSQNPANNTESRYIAGQATVLNAMNVAGAGPYYVDAYKNDANTTQAMCNFLGFNSVVAVRPYWYDSCGDNVVYQFQRFGPGPRNGFFPPIGACSFNNWVLELTCRGRLSACGDGIDNDGDGLIDFPQDPGCANSFDTSEFPHDPDCTDGNDNSEAPQTPVGCSGACNTGLMGVCSFGHLVGTAPNCFCVPNTPATVEVCDSLDNNCNGQVDEGSVCGGGVGPTVCINIDISGIINILDVGTNNFNILAVKAGSVIRRAKGSLNSSEMQLITDVNKIHTDAWININRDIPAIIVQCPVIPNQQSCVSVSLATGIQSYRQSSSSLKSKLNSLLRRARAAVDFFTLSLDIKNRLLRRIRNLRRDAADQDADNQAEANRLPTSTIRCS